LHLIGADGNERDFYRQFARLELLVGKFLKTLPAPRT
jgi:hypothetical protein